MYEPAKEVIQLLEEVKLKDILEINRDLEKKLTKESFRQHLMITYGKLAISKSDTIGELQKQNDYSKMFRIEVKISVDQDPLFMVTNPLQWMDMMFQMFSMEVKEEQKVEKKGFLNSLKTVFKKKTTDDRRVDLTKQEF